MKIRFHSTGDIVRPKDIEVELDAIPRPGDHINVWPEVHPTNRYIRSVTWVITHDEDDAPLSEPYVYIVVGPHRRDV